MLSLLYLAVKLSYYSSKPWHAGVMCMNFSEPSHQLVGVNIMSKEQKSNKENKKKPALSPKEKKAVKKSRKESNS
jgi:hypothetical protein